MAHPLVTIHGRQWTDFLSYIKDSIAVIALEESQSSEQVDKLLAQYLSEIESNRDAIFLDTAYGIVGYCNFYNVRPTEGVHDEFKGIYFSGFAVSSHLKRVGLMELNKLHLKAMLRLLDFRLQYPHKVWRPTLTSRILSVIDNNSIDNHLGQYGWYLIYKCLFNAANEKSKTI